MDADFAQGGTQKQDIVKGDFAQLPPVCATSLLAHSPVQESQASGLRGRAHQGQRRFREFRIVIRLRRLYRQRKADAYRDSIARLRDAACSVEDHELWKTHELPNDEPPTWEGSDNLLDQALVLVVENEMCGRLNGDRMRARAVSPANRFMLEETEGAKSSTCS